jgi:RHS repeat-associated protein
LLTARSLPSPRTRWRNRRPLRRRVSGRSYFYVHTDHLSTPRMIEQPGTDQLVWRWDADPFGTAAPNENPAGLGTFTYNLRFPGQYYQAEIGLNQNVFRDYDPLAGKYVESDPIGVRGGIDTYAYVGDNPLTFHDPSGLAPSPSRTAPSVFPALPVWPSDTSLSHDAELALEDWLNQVANAIREACRPNEKDDCLKEIEQCVKTCQRARSDPNQRNVWAGSWWRCLTGCVSFRCQKYIDEQKHGDPQAK